MKTVFGEELKVGDEIMYIYKSLGTEIISFGTILEIEQRPNAMYSCGYQERLHVMKECEMSAFKKIVKEIGKKVILTNPLAFKCNQVLRSPLYDTNR